FKSRLDDIRAHKGVFVTTVGYQDGALTVAKKNRIALAVVRGTCWSGICAMAADNRTVANSYVQHLKKILQEHHGQLPSGLIFRLRDKAPKLKLAESRLGFCSGYSISRHGF